MGIWKLNYITKKRRKERRKVGGKEEREEETVIFVCVNEPIMIREDKILT